VAREAGAAETVRIVDNRRRIIDEVIGLTLEGRDLEGCDRVIEAVGEQWSLDLATELMRERGRLIIAGYHQDGPRMVNMRLWNWRGLDVVNAHDHDPSALIAGMREAVEAIVEGRLDPAPFYSHTCELDRIDQAMKMTGNRPDGFLKALVMITER
jgi:threonine dehydrogenase-like Zn-dependent dehydrogenase